MKRGSEHRMPPGFRRDYAYQIVAGFFPNGSQVLHYYVINEGGDTVPMPSELITVLDPLTTGYRGISEGGVTPEPPCTPRPIEFTVENRFPIPNRVWSITWDSLKERYEEFVKRFVNPCDPVHTFRRLVKDLTTYDSNWNVMLAHNVQANPEESSVIVQWSYPVAGILTMTLVPDYTN